jgi:uncharacterized repeat protein (TIGR02543 family)
VQQGDKATQPTTTPTRTGYTFGGWYKEAACANDWNFASDVVTGNVTLYAKWTAGTTAVETRHATSLQVYPNPVVNEELIVNNEEWKTGDKIEVYSLSGALLKTFVATGARSTIDLSTLPAGTYIVKTGNRAAKVVKQ